MVDGCVGRQREGRREGEREGRGRLVEMLEKASGPGPGERDGVKEWGPADLNRLFS